MKQIYDYQSGRVKPECLQAEWQTSGSSKVIRLAFNLYCNGTPGIYIFEDPDTASLVGEMAGDSGRTVQRYIRLAELIPTLLEAVDSGKMPMTVGEKLSFLKKEVQQWVAYAIADCGICPTRGQAEQLKNMQEMGALTEGKVFSVLMKKEKNSQKVTIPVKKIRAYFPPEYTKTEIEEVIYKLLEQWKKETGEEDPVNGENTV